MTVEQAPAETPKATASDWFQSAVVYQIYPRSFADSNGDGIGDLRGIISKLDYLQRLGVDVVWLSPIYTSPQDDNGYDISDYRNVDPLFGTLDELRELTDGLHARGMKLVMDLVVNHTSDEHPWFVESRSSKENPKRDWYWWRQPREPDAGASQRRTAAEPNNWGSAFSGPAWEFDQVSGEYYLHIFSKKQPDLNWENPEVRAAVYEMMNWWLDRGVDGFRMDVINFISKDTALPDGPVADGKLFGDGSPFYIDGPRMHEFLQEMHREVFAGRTGELLTVAEMPGVTVADAILYTDPARAEVDMVFQFEHVALDQEDGDKWRPKKLLLTELKQTLGRWQDGLAETGWNSLYWGNHDQARAVSRFGDDGRLPRALRQDAGRHPAPAPGHALRLPGRGTGHDQHDVRRDQRLPGHRGPQPPPRGHHAPRPHRRRGPRRPRAAEPGQRTHPGPVGRLPARRVHHRGPLDRGEPERQPHQRRRPGGRSGLGLQLLPQAHRAAPRRTGGLPRELHHAPAGRPARLRVHPGAGWFSGRFPPAVRQTARPELLVLGNFSGEERDAELGDEAWQNAEPVLGNYPSDGGSPTTAVQPTGVQPRVPFGGGAAAGAMRLRPWELRVLRRRSGA